jgi:alpha-aminoadipate carrier protein LysW
MPTSICPECSEEVFVDAEIEQGESVSCDECSAKLVVVGLDPIELDLYDESHDEGLTIDDDFHSYDYDDDRY